jgi:hypothetical protein
MDRKLLERLLIALGLMQTPLPPEEYEQEGPYLSRNIEPDQISARETYRQAGRAPMYTDDPFPFPSPEQHYTFKRRNWSL